MFNPSCEVTLHSIIAWPFIFQVLNILTTLIHFKIVIDKMSPFHISICEEQLKKSWCHFVHLCIILFRKYYNRIQKHLCSVLLKAKCGLMQNVTLHRVSPYAESDSFGSSENVVVLYAYKICFRKVQIFEDWKLVQIVKCIVVNNMHVIGTVPTNNMHTGGTIPPNPGICYLAEPLNMQRAPQNIVKHINSVLT